MPLTAGIMGGEEDGADQGHDGMAAPSAGELDAAVNTTDVVEVPTMDSDEDDRLLIPAGASAFVLVAAIICGASCLPAYTLAPFPLNIPWLPPWCTSLH